MQRDGQVVVTMAAAQQQTVAGDCKKKKRGADDCISTVRARLTMLDGTKGKE